MKSSLCRLSTIILFTAFILACQSNHSSQITTPNDSQPYALAQKNTQPRFAIIGKIGITTITPEGKKAGSAFYTWGQDGQRFAIHLTGALGMGAIHILFDGDTASLTSDNTTILAKTPEELLSKATGWQAPISQLPYWIMGRSAPNDSNPVIINHQLVKTSHSDWTVNFEYATNNLPNRLIINHTTGHRVVITISHQANKP